MKNENRNENRNNFPFNPLPFNSTLIRERRKFYGTTFKELITLEELLFIYSQRRFLNLISSPSSN